MKIYTRNEQLYQDIASTVSQFVDPHTYHIFLFGSRARGDNTRRSDIDIGHLIHSNVKRTHL
ncbi:MAG: nucleotidyltransferase domain-containing protein [Candidatus Magasanikbacteria bacterium]|nr:nucleotidyltransferase domain-containing protein [Candidatus Magasanikbacteria bacterium]